MSSCMFCNSNSFKQLGSYRCNTRKGRELFKNSIIVECTGCHSVQLSPLPSDDKLTEYYTSFYRSDDEHNHVKLDMFPADNIWYLSRGRGIGRFVADHVSPDLSGSTPRILEVGAGFGYNLWALRECYPNADIVACEPDPTCKPFLEKLGASIIPFMADLDIINKLAKEKPFDIVVMSHVLEHLLNPIEIIKALLGLLNTNGFIVIEVPCCMTPVRN